MQQFNYSSPFDAFTDQELVTRVVWAEARGEPIEGMVAVANVIKNRTKNPDRYSQGWRGVCLKPKQFSCLNEGDPNRVQIFNLGMSGEYPLKAYRECQWAVVGVMEGWLKDNTKGSDHYYSTSLMTAPYWAKDMKVFKQIGDHVFLQDI